MSLFNSPIVVDVETAPHPCAVEYVPAPDLESIKAAGNLKDPEKIKADIDARKQKAQAEHAESLARAALDWNINRIVALGWSCDGGESVIVKPCQDEAEEANALRAFWNDAEGREFLGFCARTFDLPVLIQRSRLLNLTYRHVNLARFGKGSVIDVRGVLTFDDARYEAIMPRSLKMFCKRFGLEVEDEVSGADIRQFVTEGNWDAIISHVTSDVRLTAALAKRIGLLQEVTETVL